MNYRRKPLPVTAIQWHEADHVAKYGYSEQPSPETGVYYKYHSRPSDPPTPMVRGINALVYDGDWIVTHGDGHKEILGPNCFEHEYEAVEVVR